MNKAAFIDKDGTFISDLPFNAHKNLVTLNVHAGLLLKSLRDAGYLMIVVSNQAGIAKGYFELTNLESANAKINELLRPCDLYVDAFYYCPHFESGVVPEFSIACDCRKLKPGMIFEAAKDYHIHLASSWMIGDILNDCEAGTVAGCRTILLDNSNETECLLSVNREPHFSVQDLHQALPTILPYSSNPQLPSNVKVSI